jgi:hypothetical protein
MTAAEEALGAETDASRLLPFVIESRRTRWRDLLSTPKGRKKLLAKLWNGDDLDKTLMTQLKPAERSIPVLLTKLRSLGAPDNCHLISARSALDGRDLDLTSALQSVFELAPGTIISCIPGKLAYYENDDRNGSYIIQASGPLR